VEEALSEYRALEESDESYAIRTQTALDFARLLENGGSAAKAAAVLARAASASPASSLDLAPERLRLALRLDDRLGARALARQILLESPAADHDASLEAPVRAALRAEEGRLPAGDRARRGRSLVAAGDPKRGVALLSRDPLSSWPAAERGANLLALARGQARLGKRAAALATVAKIPQDESAPSFEARLLGAELALGRLPSPGAAERDARLALLDERFGALAAPQAPPSVRSTAIERRIRLAYESENFEAGLSQARLLVAEFPGTRAGFEPLWKLAWGLYRAGDYAGARSRIESLAPLYGAVDLRRRLDYWRARCFEREGSKGRAMLLYLSLASGQPPDLYALFARRRAPARPPKRPPLPDPSQATATFRRVDELLRLRLFAEASAEARQLPSSRGRDLRLAESEFSLGRFPAAAAAVKRAFPEMGTAEEGRVPDGWRRLYYPIEEGGFLEERAREFGLDPSLLRGLVRQESLFQPNARSRAGALGLTQLLPSTARSVARSVLRVRYRRAFLYDPGVNARIGAAYLKRLADRFDENYVYALAAYNGGPGRMATVIAQNPGLDEDEVFESHPAWESRDYVRRVMLYAESYRQLYP
jgi:soluble lytic murein transglycosylase